MKLCEQWLHDLEKVTWPPNQDIFHQVYFKSYYLYILVQVQLVKKEKKGQRQLGKGGAIPCQAALINRKCYTSQKNKELETKLPKPNCQKTKSNVSWGHFCYILNVFSNSLELVCIWKDISSATNSILLSILVFLVFCSSFHVSSKCYATCISMLSNLHPPVIVKVYKADATWQDLSLQYNFNY